MKFTFNKICLTFAVVVMAAIMAGCGSSKSVTARHGHSGKPATEATVPKRHIDFSTSRPAVTTMLLREADSWIGTAYAYGGNDRKGVDCSGLVCQVYDNALKIKLPRTSVQQSKYCRPIDRKDLREGDLVFFTVRGGSNIGHVGIYVGNNEVLHSSSSRGVIISSLANGYYDSNFHSAGRVERYFAMIGNSDSPSPSPSPVVPPVSAPAVTAPVKPEVPATVPQADPVKAAPAPAILADVRQPRSVSQPDKKSGQEIASAGSVSARTTRVDLPDASIVTVQPEAKAATVTEKEDSGLENLSEFFD